MRGLLIVVNYEQEQEIESFLDDLAGTEHPLEVVLVDDGSRDLSADIAEARGIKVIRHDRNYGVGKAIRSGIRYAQQAGTFDFVAIMSSNGKMHADELDSVIRPILEDRADYVQGSRFTQGGKSLSLSLFRAISIPIFSIFASMVLGRRFTDITCGFRAYRLTLFENPRVNLDQDWLDKYEAELYIHYYACRLGYRIVEVPVTIDYSQLAPDRKSKMRPFSGWWSLARPFLLLATHLRK